MKEKNGNGCCNGTHGADLDSVHGDLRFQIDSQKLEGWTLNLILSIKSDPENYSDAKKLIDKKLSDAIKLLLDPTKKTVSEKKSLEPIEWLVIDKTTFPEGTVGGTKNLKGYMGIVDKGIVEFGAKKPHFVEYFLSGEIFNGRLIFTLRPNVWRKQSIESGEPSKTGKGYTVWMCFFADDEPYTISSRALKKNWYPPVNISALPRKIRNQIPSEYQYWKIKDQSKAHKVRNELIKSIKKKEIILEYAEDQFSLTSFGVAPPEPPKEEWTKKKPQVSQISTPSKSVINKIKSTLLYDPPSNLKFWWHLKGKGIPVLKEGKTILKKGRTVREHCPSCLWLAQNSPFTVDTLPTYPGEGKTECKCKDGSTLEVVFPDDTYYDFLPVKDPKFYEAPWLKDWKTEKYAKEHDKETIKTGWAIFMNELEHNKDIVKTLLVDFKNMNKVDKAFMIFAGAPLIKDLAVAWKQAFKEGWNTLSTNEKENFLRLRSKETTELRSDFDKKVERILFRILNEGQLKQIEEQLPALENFFLELASAGFVKPVTKFCFKTIATKLKSLKNFSDKGMVGKIIKSCFVEADIHRNQIMMKKIAEAKANATNFIGELKYWGLNIGDKILDEIDYFISFWKDTVLIYAPGVPIRNMLDNTLKAINEMINSAFKGNYFWAFMKSKGTPIIPIPKEVSKGFFVKVMGEIPEGKISWYHNMRNFLYQSFLGRPEEVAREWFFTGKVSMWAKQLMKQGKNVDDFIDIMKTKGIKEVNRVFFDYEKRMAIEIPLSRISPFFTFNIRNANYWLKDFMYHPWKLGFIRGAWDWWSKRTGQIDFKIRDLIPSYLIPGTFFDPLQWTSANKFIELFAKYKGEQKWLTEREAHLKGQVEMLKSVPQENRTKIYSQAKIKNMQDYQKRQEFRWEKVTVKYLDRFIGILPLWKKVLEYIGRSEPEPWRTMFPQSQLVDVVGSTLFNDFYRSIKPPGTQELHYLYGIIDKQGGVTKEEIDKKIEKKIAKLSSTEKEEREKTMTWEKEKKEREEIKKELRSYHTKEIYRLWQVQKKMVAYMTGAYLVRSWEEIYKVHVAIADELATKD
jgi:hypothetical protein